MKEYKLLFTGPMGAGKTTAIQTISDTTLVSTEVANSDSEVAKATTTVGFDLGQFTLENGDRLRLFGTPGQARFDFMWRILSRNALGLIMLFDNSRADPLGDLALCLTHFAEELQQIPCVIGVGRLESHPQPSLDAYAESLAAHGLLLPILAVDVRKREDVLCMLDTLLIQIETMDLPEHDH